MNSILSVSSVLEFVESSPYGPDDPDHQWISGIYKIQRYSESADNRYRPTYRAYYIRTGDRNWGYYVETGVPFYQTLAAAQSACQRHADSMIKES